MWITRLHQQHSSVVTTIPKSICKMFGLSAGDYIQFNEWKDGGTICIKKLDNKALHELAQVAVKNKAVVGGLNSRGEINGGDTGSSDKQDSGR